MNKKICLITWFNSLNYGTCIQCSALSQYLKKLGYYVFVPDSLQYYYGIKHPIESFNRILRKIKYKIIHPIRLNTFDNLPDNIKNGYKVRMKKNAEFSYEYNNIYKITSNKDFQQMIKTTEVFITGSDQIWNPAFCSPTLLLSFVNQGKRISYASSIGVPQISCKYEKMYKKYLSRFDALAVREKTAKSALEILLKDTAYNKPIQVVLDPSFLLTSDEWKKMTNVAVASERKFVFTYFIGGNRNWETTVQDFVAQKNLDLYCAISEANVIPNVGIVKADMGVEEFISYIANAEYVVTDSFHAVALSIIFNKKFVVYKRFSDANKDSQNSRITDLLNLFRIPERLVENDISCIDDEIDYSKINDIIDSKRTEAKTYLLNSIEN